MDWNPETQRIFNSMVDDVCPPEYRMMARFVIPSLAEKYAKAKGSNIIENPDMVNAFMEGVPGPFQADMKAGLKKFGLLPGEKPPTTEIFPPVAKKVANKVVKKAVKKATKKTSKKIARKS